MPNDAPTAAWKRGFTQRLLRWFDRHQRQLPWRDAPEPYRVWVSEIMLQQTQVATVIPYFTRFLQAFPTVTALANAEEQAVLRLWEGLGYYRRARQLHAAAKQIAAQHGGRFPDSFEAIRNLPGIGRYTAGAIWSIAYNRPAPILEANTIRLLSRLFAVEGDVSTRYNQQLLWQWAEAILPSQNFAAFNQALMELGSLVCTPGRPNCADCPVHLSCAAFQQGRQQEIPAPRVRVKFEDVREAAVVIWRRDKVFVRQRQADERWAGLWDFVRFPISARRGQTLADELRDKVQTQSGLLIGTAQRFTTLKHGVTRFRITLDCYRAEQPSGRVRLKAGEYAWARPDELGRLPLSTTGRKLSRLLNV